MTFIAVPDRALVVVSGEVADDFLQALITTDLGQLGAGEVRPGALLTPQGKILFDFLVSRIADGLRLETDAAQAPGLLKRLTLYKLRAAIDLSLEAPAAVAVSFEPQETALKDVRFTKAGIDVWRAYGVEGSPDATNRFETERIAAGIAVSGLDFALQDAFPHDVLLDKNGGLSFRKGCYVGQEVVSRMQHRGTARRRVVIVKAASDLPVPGTAITAGGKAIGTLGSTAGATGLAIVRIDKAGEAMATGTGTGTAILSGDVPVTLALPAWTELGFPTAAADEAGA